MSRRTQLALVPSVVAAFALVGTACGEQTPGGMPVDPQQTETSTEQEPDTEPDAEPAGGDSEGEGDAEDPIVVKIGEDEFLTTMAIYHRYDAAKGGPLALLGPVAPAEEVADGNKQDYRDGAIYWHSDTGANIVRGQILATYLDNGGPGGRLGWPVGDETVEGEAIYSDFQHGQIRLEGQSIRVVENAG